MSTAHDSIQTALEQMNIARAEITLGIERLRAAEPLSPDCALMASAILEYFAMQIAIETAQADDAKRASPRGQLTHAMSLPTHARSTMPDTTIELARPTFTRGRPDALCGTCQKPFAHHPLATENECLDDAEHKPFLTRLCDGALVKLGR